MYAKSVLQNYEEQMAVVGFWYLQTAQRTWFRILSIALEEKIKGLDFV